MALSRGRSYAAGEAAGPSLQAAAPNPAPLLLTNPQVGDATVAFRPEWDRHRLTPRHTAYLRVAEGCSHACTFCAIPGFRCAGVTGGVGQREQAGSGWSPRCAGSPVGDPSNQSVRTSEDSEKCTLPTKNQQPCPSLLASVCRPS